MLESTYHMLLSSLPCTRSHINVINDVNTTGVYTQGDLHTVENPFNIYIFVNLFNTRILNMFGVICVHLAYTPGLSDRWTEKKNLRDMGSF